MKNSINWARQFINIDPADERMILSAKQSLLYNEETPWIKKGDNNFDVTMGSYDGAETCELVGLFMLSKLNKLDRVNVGLYSDDGLLVTRAPPRQAENTKKKICAIFSEHNLNTSLAAPGALAHRLQHLTVHFIQNGRRGLGICQTLCY